MKEAPASDIRMGSPLVPPATACVRDCVRTQAAEPLLKSRQPGHKHSPKHMLRSSFFTLSETPVKPTSALKGGCWPKIYGHERTTWVPVRGEGLTPQQVGMARLALRPKVF